MLAADLAQHLSAYRAVVGLVVLAGLYAVLLETRRSHRRNRKARPVVLVTGLDPQRNFTARQRAAIYRRDGGRCRLCGVRVHYRSHHWFKRGCNNCYQTDHRHPHSRGGPTTIANGLTLCAFHNQSKGALTVEEYLESQGIAA